MIKRGRLPGTGGVALAALTRKVIGRLVAGVARQAFGLTGVIECGRQPRTRRVTVAALSGVMVRRPIGCVAALAIRLPGVIERRW